MKFLIATALFVIVAGGGLMYIFMQQQPDGELFAQADFDVQDKTMADARAGSKHHRLTSWPFP